jgi:gluconolactonase
MRRREVLGAAAALPIASSAAAAPATPRGIRRLSPKLDAILDASSPVEMLGGGYQWSEGPVWVPRGGGMLLFSDVPANRMWRWRRERGFDLFLTPSGLAGPIPPTIREAGSNGLALDGRGRLLIADSGSRTIARLDFATRKKTVVVDRFEGKRFNSPNDVICASDGALYFTDPPYGLADGDTSPLRELDFCGVYRLGADGRLAVLDRTVTRPNGIALSPDEGTLYVAVSDPKGPVLFAYTLDARGMPTARRVLVDFAADLAAGGPGLPDGMKVAAEGHLFASGPGGMHVLSPEGERLGLIQSGDVISNCAIGEGGAALYMTSNHDIARISLKPGRPA